jgi:sporulation protein YlmC with PRC-barrel domain
MKRYWKSLSNLLAVLSIVGLSATVATAQTQAQNNPARTNQDRVRVNAGVQADASQIDEKTQGATIRASELIGMDIETPQGEDIGEISDLVMEVRTGRIRYAAVTYGGFLGIGDKLFAVPFEAFQWKREADDADDYHLVLNVTQQQMEGAVGFDQDHWPNFADQNFTRDLDKRYGVDRRARNRDRDGGVGVRIDRDGIDVDVSPNRDPNRVPRVERE